MIPFLDQPSVHQKLTYLKTSISDILLHSSTNNTVEWFDNIHCLVLYGHGEEVYKEVESFVNEHHQPILSDVLKCLDQKDFHKSFSVLTKAWKSNQMFMRNTKDMFIHLDRYSEKKKNPTVYNMARGIFDNCINAVFIAESKDLKEKHGDIITSFSYVEDVVKLRNRYNILLADCFQNDDVVFQKIMSSHLETSVKEDISKCFPVLVQHLTETFGSVCVKRYIQALLALKDLYDSIIAESFEDDLVFKEAISSSFEKVIKDDMKRFLTMENSGLPAIMKKSSKEDLGVIFQLLKRVPNGHSILRDWLSAHLRNEGQRLMEAGGHGWKIIQKVLDLRDRYDTFLVQLLDDDPHFKRAISSSFEHILNSSNVNSAYYLSLFIDEKMRQGFKNMNEEEVNRTLDKFIILFRYLEGKDSFENFYRLHLGNRLLTFKRNKFSSEENEKIMLSKLKAECGASYTITKEGMINDVLVTSEDLLPKFKSFLITNRVTKKDLGGMEFNVRVLSSRFWRLKPPPPYILPAVAEGASELFRTFYAHYFKTVDGKPSRKLIFLPHVGGTNVILNARFFGDGVDGRECESAEVKPRHYELVVSTFHMCILMLFNANEDLTLEEISTGTNLDNSDVIQALESITLGKSDTGFLVMEESDSKEILQSSVFRVNEHFRSSKFRVNVNLKVKTTEENHETEQMDAHLLENRKFEIQAAIVRIMKNKKTLGHPELMSEVIENIIRFKPQLKYIGKQINHLIENNYLQLDAKTNVYTYLA